MKLGHGPRVPEYTIFLSSADDAIDLRERVDGLINNAVQPVLRNSGVEARFYLDMWEKTAPRRLEEDETIDDEFVERAVNSNLMMTLAVERLGSGTRKEIEAVLASRTELAMLWFVDANEHPDTPVGKFATELEENGVVRYNKAGRPSTNRSWEAIVRLLLQAVLAASEPQEEGYREQR